MIDRGGGIMGRELHKDWATRTVRVEYVESGLKGLAVGLKGLAARGCAADEKAIQEETRPTAAAARRPTPRPRRRRPQRRRPLSGTAAAFPRSGASWGRRCRRRGSR